MLIILLLLRGVLILDNIKYYIIIILRARAYLLYERNARLVYYNYQ